MKRVLLVALVFAILSPVGVSAAQDDHHLDVAHWSFDIVGAIKAPVISDVVHLGALEDGRDWLVITMSAQNTSDQEREIHSDDIRLRADEELLKQTGDESQEIADELGYRSIGGSFPHDIPAGTVLQIVQVYKVAPDAAEFTLVFDFEGQWEVPIGDLLAHTAQNTAQLIGVQGTPSSTANTTAQPNWTIETSSFQVSLIGAVKGPTLSGPFHLGMHSDGLEWLVVTFEIHNTSSEVRDIKSGWIRLLSHGKHAEQLGDPSRSVASEIDFATLTKEFKPGERINIVQVYAVDSDATDFTIQISSVGNWFLNITPVIEATSGNAASVVPGSDRFDIASLPETADMKLVPTVVPSPTPTPTPTHTPTPLPTHTPEPTKTPEPTATSAPPVRAVNSCADFDAWEWAQTVFDINPQAYAVLDADGDGIACPELPRNGFAPAFWKERIPENLEVATVIRVVDGDTLELQVGGTTQLVTLYRADAPEAQGEQQCGGQQSADFTEWVLGWNSTPGVVYLERDENLQDSAGNELGYIWFESAGLPYLLNHVVINNGWAEDSGSTELKYDQPLKDAAEFAKRHQLGVYAECGEFGQPLAAPTAAPQPTGIQAEDQPTGGITSQEEAYFSAVLDDANEIANIMGELGPLFNRAGEDPYLIVDPSWQYEVAELLVRWQIVSEGMRNHSPSARQQHIQEMWLEISNSNLRSIDLIISGIDNLDPGALMGGVACINYSTALADDVTRAIEAFYDDPDAPFQRQTWLSPGSTCESFSN